ncbi:MAG: putative toxin [Vulcanimicrobiaceae bacterium]
MNLPNRGGGFLPPQFTSAYGTQPKNVRTQSFTQQLRDSAQHAQETIRQFDLYVRPSTVLSKPLKSAIQSGTVNLNYIP